MNATRNVILNFHDPNSNSIAENFVCNILDHAESSCETIRMLERNQSQTAQNVRSDATVSSLDRLLLHASKKGILNMTRSRGSYLRLLEKIGVEKQELHQLPMICPSEEELEKLLSESLALEEVVLPDFAKSVNGEVAHRQSFAKLLKKKSFCHVDTDAVLKNVTSWDQLVGLISQLSSKGSL